VTLINNNNNNNNNNYYYYTKQTTGIPTHPHKSVCEIEDVTVLWNQGVCNNRKVIANRQAIIIKNKTNELTDVAMTTDRK